MGFEGLLRLASGLRGGSNCCRDVSSLAKFEANADGSHRIGGPCKLGGEIIAQGGRTWREC